MRPILFDVDVSARPARMTLCFPDTPRRFITVRIRANVTTEQDAKLAAFRELEGFTRDQLQLLAESSAPMAFAPDPDALSATITRVDQEQRYPGMLHCPACCHAVGRMDSPAIGYVDRCSSCKRRLKVRFAPGTVTVILWTD